VRRSRVGLTQDKIADLHERRFDRLFKKHIDLWSTMATNAFADARDHICNGNAPLRDDILKMLLPMLEPNDFLRAHQEKNRARNKKFKQFFAEYIIEIVCFELDLEDE
jgi:hypothetical protein